MFDLLNNRLDQPLPVSYDRPVFGIVVQHIAQHGIRKSTAGAAHDGHGIGNRQSSPPSQQRAPTIRSHARSARGFFGFLSPPTQHFHALAAETRLPAHGGTRGIARRREARAQISFRYGSTRLAHRVARVVSVSAHSS